MTYNACCELMGELEILTEGNGPGDQGVATLVDKAFQTMEELSQTFHTTITRVGILPRHLNDMQLRLTKLEIELRAKHFNGGKENYAQVISDFYTHYHDIMGHIGTAMGTRDLDYDTPHILTWKGFVPLRDGEEKEYPAEKKAPPTL